MSAPIQPFELYASADALRAVRAGIQGWTVGRIGTRISQLWLKGVDGQCWLLDVEQRDVRPMFEVFGLAISSLDELTERWRNGSLRFWTMPSRHGLSKF